jgi:8-oxo-dGTP diphosphatase
VTEIAVAVIIEGNELVLSKRLDHVHQGGKWEFPGGKVEAGETAAKALVRECFEELAIKVKGAALVDTFDFEYPGKALTFHVFFVDDFSGTPHGSEGQEVARVHWSVLRELEFPEANIRMIDLVERHFKRQEGDS